MQSFRTWVPSTLPLLLIGRPGVEGRSKPSQVLPPGPDRLHSQAWSGQGENSASVVRVARGRRRLMVAACPRGSRGSRGCSWDSVRGPEGRELVHSHGREFNRFLFLPC